MPGREEADLHLAAVNDALGGVLQAAVDGNARNLDAELAGHLLVGLRTSRDIAEPMRQEGYEGWWGVTYPERERPRPWGRCRPWPWGDQNGVWCCESGL